MWTTLPAYTRNSCRWISGFTPFGPDLVQQLRSPGFADLTVEVDGVLLPIRGLGRILAVALLLNDVDCIGGTGNNVGYTLIRVSILVLGLYNVKTVTFDPLWCLRTVTIRPSQFRRSKLTQASHFSCSTSGSTVHLCFAATACSVSYPASIISRCFRFRRSAFVSSGGFLAGRLEKLVQRSLHDIKARSLYAVDLISRYAWKEI